nr:C-type natriuretic peptide-like [Paramormyrops kingsleyae]
MVSSPASGPMSPWTLWLLILLLSVASLVKSRPPPLNSENQIADGLFGTRGGSLLQNHLDPCGGCEVFMPPAWRGGRGTHTEPEIEPRNATPSLLLDFMGRQRKFKGRTRKSSQMGGGLCRGLNPGRLLTGVPGDAAPPMRQDSLTS